MSGNQDAGQNGLPPHAKSVESPQHSSVSEKTATINDEERSIREPQGGAQRKEDTQRDAGGYAKEARAPTHVADPPIAPAPGGGLKGWLFVLAACLLFISAWGLTQIFGAFQEIYLKSLLPDSSASAISWIGSVQCFILIALGVFTGPLFDAGFLRPLLLLGCTLIVLGMGTLSLATRYWQVFLAQGVCLGVGGGLIYVPSLALVATMFPPSSRPWAIGCVNAGGSIGGLIFIFMLRRLEPTIGFPWAVRAIALVNLILSIVALAIILPHRPPPASKRRAIIDVRAFREPSFIMFTIALLLNYVAFYIPAFYVPVYATTVLGQSQSFGFDCLAFISVGSLLGRTLPMLAAGRVGSLQVYLAGSTVAIIVILSWIAIHNVVGLVIFCLLYGAVSGVLVAAPSAAISHPVLTPSMDVIGTRMGMSWMFGAVGVLIGGPIAGALVDLELKHFVPAQAFAGGMVAAGSSCLIVPLIAVIKYKGN